ncbi:hypothetical protein M951_chr377 (nucleomorph) [Lotharella oceanica]|uniref:Uncharacterized protein n=1 Tax=Lotharella oceanica TaxID=641309 RepID=A0A060D7P5_9EUKA|nr:hypothetical protein M951_chr377 [Lotharella oceanica]|mmetsp:Transcript_4849/g.9636  ORF Transcript_4849/g.9636 Transcript_4849/m.9636 type:complete len:92 (+) Transcript_4849:2301-2576(+)
MIILPKKSNSGWVVFFSGLPSNLSLYIIKFCLYHYSKKNIKYKIFLLFNKKNYSTGFVILENLYHCIFLIECLNGLKIINSVFNMSWAFIE